jgi:tetratricopeptide (TPR) repeat protein
MTLKHLLSTPFISCLLAAVMVVGCSNESRQARSMERAKAFLDAGELEKAKIEYMSIIQKQPTNAEAFRQVGWIWSQQGSGIQAVRFLSRAEELEELPAEMRLKLGRGLLVLGAVVKAREQAEAVLQKDAANGEALVLLAEAVSNKDELEATRQRLDAFPDKNAARYHLATVPVLLRENRLIEAEEAAAKAVAADPKLAEAHLTAGVLRVFAKDQTGAADAYRKASELASPRTNERLRYADFIAQQGKRDEARALVAEALKQAPDYIPAMILSAQLALAAGQVDEALGMLEKAQAIDASNIGAGLLYVEVLIAKVQINQALEVLKRLDQTYAGSSLVRTRLIRLLIDSNRYQEAEDLLKPMLTDESKEIQAEASLLMAGLDLIRRNPAATVARMQTFLEKQSDHEGAQLLLARGLEGQRRFDQALEVVRPLAERRPEVAEYQMRMGEILLQLNRVDEARTHLKKTAELQPKDRKAWQMLVELDLLQGNNDGALEKTNNRIASEPDVAANHLMLARVFFARKELDKAESELKRALAIDAGTAGAHEMLARLYVTQQRAPEAVAKLRERLATNAKDAGALRLLALLLSEQKEYAEAATIYERLIDATSSPEPFVLNNLAAIYSDHLEKPDRALELARQARALLPSVSGATSEQAKLEAAAIADTLGWLLYQKRDYREAMLLLQEAAGPLAANPEVQAHLGLTAAALGLNEVAESSLRQAVESVDEFPIKAAARQQLALVTGATDDKLTRADLEAMIKESPDNSLLYVRVAEVQEREGDLTAAANSYISALAKSPTLVDPTIKLAKWFAGPLADPAKALTYARKARELASGNPEVAALLGRLVLENGEAAYARDLLSEALRTGGKNAGSQFWLAKATYATGLIPEAREEMESAVALSLEEPLAAEAASFMALTATPAPVTGVAQAALAKDPENVPALMVRASAEASSRDLAAATATYVAILQKLPDFAPAQARLAALIADDASQRTRAYSLAVKARETLRNDPELAETLGKLAFHRGDHQRAVTLFDEASAVRPAPSQALYYRGKAEWAQGKVEEAKATFGKAMAAGLAGPEAEDTKKLMESALQ